MVIFVVMVICNCLSVQELKLNVLLHEEVESLAPLLYQIARCVSFFQINLVLIYLIYFIFFSPSFTVVIKKKEMVITACF